MPGVMAGSPIASRTKPEHSVEKMSHRVSATLRISPFRLRSPFGPVRIGVCRSLAQLALVSDVGTPAASAWPATATPSGDLPRSGIIYGSSEVIPRCHANADAMKMRIAGAIDAVPCRRGAASIVLVFRISQSSQPLPPQRLAPSLGDRAAQAPGSSAVRQTV